MAKIRKATDQRPFTMIYHDFLDSYILNKDEKLVFMYLKRYSDEKKQAFPSIRKLVEITGIHTGKVQKCLKHLEELGIIEIERRKTDKGDYTSNLYTLNDCAEIWRTNGSKEEIKKIIDTEKEKECIKYLEKIGYTFINAENEKVVSILPQTETTFNNLTLPKVKINTDTDIIEQDDKCQQNDNKKLQNDTKNNEKVSLEQVKSQIDYDVIVSDNKAEKELIDSIVKVIYDTINTTKNTIRVNKENKPKQDVINVFRQLNMYDVTYCINAYKNNAEPIKNTISYITTLLYNCHIQKELDFTNKVSVNESLDKKKVIQEQKQNANFTTSRKYDFDALEKAIMQEQ